MKLKDSVSWQTSSGDKVTVGDSTITPQAQALIVRWPGGGAVWNRPLAVTVERDGQTQRLAIVDATRAAQLTLLGLGLLFAAATVLLSTRQRREQRD